MNIIGESQTGTIINGTNTNWIFNVGYNINVTITNLTLTNGNASEGSDIYNCGNLTLTNCTLTHNYAIKSGAISSEGNLAATNCTFTDNTASVSGAISNIGGTTSLSGCTFTNNTATYNGGAISSVGFITGLSGCTFTNNTASVGGAIYGGTPTTTITISGCTFTNNTATDYGGAIYNIGTLTAKYNRFYNNTAATDGNAIYCSQEGSANANYNWWSSNLNPKNIDNLIYDPGNLVDATYWVILTVTASPSSIKNTQTSIITADLNHYTDSSGNIGTLTDHIPDVPLTFAVDANGNLDSLSGIISNGRNVATTFKATRKSLATVNAVVDEFTCSTALTITNNPPTVPNYDVTTQEDTSTSSTVDGNDVDTEDVLSYSVTKNPSHDTLTSFNPNTGAWTYMPSKDYDGDDSFEVTVSDGDGGTAVSKVTIHVTAVNDAPTVGNYSVKIPEDSSTNGNVVGSDVDSTLTYSLGNQAPHGTAVVNTDGTWTYTPNHNYNGPDSFTVTVSDGLLTAASTVFITVTPVNDAPIAQNDTKTIDEDTSATGRITATDADGDALAYTKDTNPAHGTATVNNNGTWTYTPEANYHGTDSFKVLVSDGNGCTTVSTMFITVNPVNDIPVAQNDTAATKEGKATDINVLSNDSDADGDSLTVNGVTQPVHGTATINADGTLTYTPNSNWYGSDSFSYTISDGNGGTATATVTITVNQAVSGLYIKTTTSSQNPKVGEKFKITYKLGNYGPDAAENVTITFQLPEGLNFVNIHVDSGKCIYNEITRTVTWTIDSVPVGDPYLYLTVQAAGDGTYNITPDITSDTYNTNTKDNGNITINVQPNNNHGNSDNENTVKAASKTTIGLQDTGLPLNYLLLAVLMVLSGLVPKRR